jgi:hypothetical protein
MKKGIVGYLISAAFVLVVVAVAFRVAFIRKLVTGSAT